MHNKGRFPNALFSTNLRPNSAALAIMVLLLFLIFVFLFLTLTAYPAQGQTFNVIYNFTGGADGGQPDAGLTIDAAGDLYGTTAQGGYRGTARCPIGCGTVFRLKRQGANWILTPLYLFKGQSDGDYPAATLTFGPDGSLYGTTLYGGAQNCSTGCGTVFKLVPDGHGAWRESVLYRFGDGVGDGILPSGPVTLDGA